MKHAWVFLFILPACNYEVAECERDARIEVYVDADGDGFGSGEPELQCSVGEGQADNGLDCNDAAADVFPGAEELCNQRDDNCDGLLDDGHATRKYYADVDGDGYGAKFPAVNVCGLPPAGYVSNDTDCDDDNDEVNPGALEICNGGTDDDCDGAADDADSSTLESSMNTYYNDTDADGFGSLNHPEIRCDLVAGLVDNFTDCDDRTAAITNFPQIADADFDGYGHEINQVMSCPGYPGTANNRDDCDDSDPWVTIPKDWYADIDGDGWGTGEPASWGCFPPNDAQGNPLAVGPYVGDCDDSDATINNGATEVCGDGIDQNCNGKLDCEDNDCSAVEECLLDCVDIGLEAVVPQYGYVPSIKAYPHDLTVPCNYGTGADVAFQWRAPEAGNYRFDTYGSLMNRYGPAIAVYDGCGSDASVLACNRFAYERYSGNYYNSKVENVALEEGQLVVIYLDSYYGYATDGVLNIIKQ